MHKNTPGNFGLTIILNRRENVPQYAISICTYSIFITTSGRHSGFVFLVENAWITMYIPYYDIHDTDRLPKSSRSSPVSFSRAKHVDGDRDVL